jgi:hypothetical protein
VKLCADDLLCPECDAANESKLKELRTKIKQSAAAAAVQEPIALVAEQTNRQCKTNNQLKNKPPPPDSIDASLVSGVSEGFAAAAGTAAADPEVKTNIHQLTKQQFICAAVPTTTDISTEHQLAALRAEVHHQQTIITMLQSQLSFVLSLLGITEHDIEFANHEADNSSGTPSNVDNPSTNQSLWSTIAAKKKTQRSPNNLQQSLIAAVYNDQSESRRRESSLIITGLSEDQQYSDSEQFQKLCRDEFNV